MKNDNAWKIEIKIKNNLLYQKIMETGCRSLLHFSEETGISYARICALLNLRNSPLTSTGKLTPTTQKLTDYFNCSVYELFTEEQTSPIKNKREVIMSTPQLKQLIAETGEAPNPLLLIEAKQQETRVMENLGKLTPREQKVLRYRFFEDLTFEETAKRFDVTGERIRQIESKALRKLRCIYKPNGNNYEQHMAL